MRGSRSPRWRDTFVGCPTHWTTLAVSAAAFASKGITQSSITAQHATRLFVKILLPLVRLWSTSWRRSRPWSSGSSYLKGLGSFMIECRGISSTSSSSDARRAASRSSSSKSSPSHNRSSAFKYLLRSSANVTRWISRTGARTSPRDRQPEAPPEVAAVWPMTSHSLTSHKRRLSHYTAQQMLKAQMPIHLSVECP